MRTEWEGKGNEGKVLYMQEVEEKLIDMLISVMLERR